ncbi:MAG TPA: hypothetical protein VF411_00450 [Bacteroidia bacterium]
MTSKKVVNKKVVLTADFYGLTQEEKLKKETDMTLAQKNNPLLVPGLNPTAVVIQNRIIALTDPNTGLVHELEMVRANEKTLVGQIADEVKAIESIIVSEWMSQTQSAIAGDVNKAATLKFGVKGVSGGGAQTSSVMEMAKTATSAPVIVKIDTDVHDEHILHIHNNITNKRGHGKDILRVDMYAQNGGTLPINFAALIANGGQLLGTAERGVYINTIIATTANSGTTVYYIAVYISKKTKKPVAYSVVASAKIK